jgi:hypothetical protein
MQGSIVVLLLDHSEFDEVVSRFERPLNLHSDLRDSTITFRLDEEVILTGRLGM